MRPHPHTPTLPHSHTPTLPPSVLRDVSFSIREGEYFVLLGPTGCGKTVLLETVCGLRLPDAGTVRIGGDDVTWHDPARRQIGYVPQDHALLPFKSVFDNLAFGLAARRLSVQETRERVGAMLKLLGIAHLAARRPAGLSGGERQRVALGRALAIHPKMLLLDEPLSAIDEGSRDRLANEIRQVQRHLGATTLHVCHSLEEAMQLADRLAVMRAGQIVQVGTPEELLTRPANLFVARFLRLRNLLYGEVRDGEGGSAFFWEGRRVCPAAISAGPAAALLPLREMALHSSPPPESAGRFVFETTILAGLPLAFRPELRLGAPAAELAVPGLFPPDAWPVGGTLFLSVPRDQVHVVSA